MEQLLHVRHRGVRVVVGHFEHSISAVYSHLRGTGSDSDPRERKNIVIARRGVGKLYIHGEMRPCNDR